MQKTAYEMRISDWSSDVCSSDRKARPEQYVDDPALILERDEDRIALARPLADQQDARGAHVRSVLRRRNLGGAQDALPLEIAADRTSVVSGKSLSVRLERGGSHIMRK